MDILLRKLIGRRICIDRQLRENQPLNQTDSYIM